MKEDVEGVFQNVAPYYDRMNDLMSLFQHHRWKETFVKCACTPFAQLSKLRVLDLAAGTGDIASLLQQSLGERCSHLDAVDPSAAMIAEGQRKNPQANWAWHEAAGEALPFKEGCFDLVTMAFGLRNTQRMETVLQEICRVLKPGGWFFCLEFSQPQSPLMEGLYQIYAHTWIPFLARFVARDVASYRYLVKSIEAFPGAPLLEDAFKAHALQETGFQALAGGIVAIHWGRRAPSEQELVI
jgi:demethylmenaquinone methyltransferase/2-methoxy-6-polyprenyl-1,4-benzoquinol methylase